MEQHKEIETCLECSAKKLSFVGEVFYYALKAVVHPTAPLFDAQEQKMKPLCVRALKRIFTMCDKDQVWHCTRHGSEEGCCREGGRFRLQWSCAMELWFEISLLYGFGAQLECNVGHFKLL